MHYSLIIIQALRTILGVFREAVIKDFNLYMHKTSNCHQYQRDRGSLASVFNTVPERGALHTQISHQYEIKLPFNPSQGGSPCALPHVFL